MKYIFWISTIFNIGMKWKTESKILNENMLLRADVNNKIQTYLEQVMLIFQILSQLYENVVCGFELGSILTIDRSKTHA